MFETNEENNKMQVLTLLYETMKGMAFQELKGINEYNLNDKSTVIIHDSAKENKHHFLTDFSYQMIMVTNDDESSFVEVSSNFSRNQKGYKVCYPPENPKQYKAMVEPNSRMVIIVQNSIPYCHCSLPYKIRLLQSQEELINECKTLRKKEPRSEKFPLIYRQVYEHDDGVIVVYSNETKDKGLTEEVTFNLQGLRF